jgi:UDP-N-acetylmuramoyl-L-alanyl-D-glutamate--2,6-diaminopimelate ligase
MGEHSSRTGGHVIHYSRRRADSGEGVSYIPPTHSGATILLSELRDACAGVLHGPDLPVTGIAVDSRQVRPGDLFVVQAGARSDGSAFLPEARRRGAVAACATAPVPGLPTLVVTDPRGAAPLLAATLYGHPGKAIRLVGITGTLGKTSTALLIQAALGASDVPVGVIGSLGVRIRGRVADTGMTTPDAPAIHRALRHMLDAGVTTAAIEVTSHALALGRVAGLTCAVGVITNLVPDEHLDFHGTADHYLRTKARFLQMLEDGAPLVINRDDGRVRAMVGDAVRRRPRPVIGVTCGDGPEAHVAVSGLRTDASGSAFALEIRAPLPRLDGPPLEPFAVPMVLPVFGVQQVANAALAATAALVAGASPTGVTEAVAEMAPIRRRMEIVRHAGPVVLDDTVGNPRTLAAVFDSIRSIPHRRLRIVFGIRGSRGGEINRRLAVALAGLVRAEAGRVPLRLVLTGSEDAAGARDRVQPDERDALLGVLRNEGIEFRYEPELEAAVRRGLENWAPDDLVLLLGAQGMDGAARIARAVLDGAPVRAAAPVAPPPRRRTR